MNKQQARRIAREVTGMLIRNYIDVGGFRDLVEVKTKEDLDRLYDAFERLRTIVEEPKNANSHPSRLTAAKQALRVRRLIRNKINW